MLKQKSEILQKIQEADAILIGASNGLSITEGLHLFADNELFRSAFGDYRARYGLRNLLDGYFYPWGSEEERWGFYSRMAEQFSVHYTGSPVMKALQTLVGQKPYFVITSNGEGHFTLAGMKAENVFEIEGSWTGLRCGKLCHTTVYPSLDAMHEMAVQQKDCRVPTALIPRCPVCGAVMRVYDAQPPKEGIQEAMNAFLQKYHNKKLVILELGIGWRNQLIKAPLMRLAAMEPEATYITVNLGEIYITEEIRGKAYGLDGYLEEILCELADGLSGKEDYEEACNQRAAAPFSRGACRLRKKTAGNRQEQNYCGNRK